MAARLHPLWRRACRALALLVAATAAATLQLPAAHAQIIPGGGGEAAEPADPQDSYGRSTPQGLATRLVEALAADDYERAAIYLGLSERERARFGAEEAQRLEAALNAGGAIAPRLQLSPAPEGQLDDNLPPDQERIGTLQLKGQAVPLLASRTVSEGGVVVWTVSADTLAAIPATLAAAPSVTDRYLPKALSEFELGGAPVGHWLVLSATAFVAFIASRLLFVGLSPLSRLVGRKDPYQRVRKLFAATAGPLSLLVSTWVFATVTAPLGISIVARAQFGRFIEVVGIVAVAWLAWRVVHVFIDVWSERMRTKGYVRASSAVLFLRRTLKAIIALFGAVGVMATVGVNVTAGVAALGVGGLALALGAQKTVENLVGGLTLIADQPVRVGDFCMIDGTLGTVEDIGLRSTRIRTLGRTLVTIPNGELASLKIENYASRDRFWFNPTLTFRYETTPEQIRYLLVKLREVLYAHPKVSPEPARVRFTGLGADMLNLDVFAYVLAVDYDEFLEVQEDLTLRFMDVVETSGASFAFPSQTVYLAWDERPEAEVGKAAEDAVRRWRDEEELQVPRFSADRIAELSGELAYPPEGSVLRRQEDDAPRPNGTKRRTSRRRVAGALGF